MAKAAPINVAPYYKTEDGRVLAGTKLLAKQRVKFKLTEITKAEGEKALKAKPKAK